MYRLILTLALIVVATALPVLAAGGEKGDVELGIFSGSGFPDSYG